MDNARRFICDHSYRQDTMYRLDGWDAMYYVCVWCVDLLKEHARRRQEQERSEGSHLTHEDDWMTRLDIEDHFGS
jgi:hypothetical protein